MKQAVRSYWIISSIIVGVLLITACSPSASTPTVVANRTFAGRTQSAAPVDGSSATATPGQPNRSNRTPASQTPTVVSATATVVAAAQIATPAAAQADAGLVSYPTPTISAIGMISLPDQKQAVSFGANAATAVITATNLTNGAFKAFQINGTAGQVLHVGVNGNVRLQVIDPEQIPVSPIVVMPGTLNVALTKTGAYTMGLTGLGDAAIGLFLSAASGSPALNAPIPAQSQAVEIPTAPLSVSFPSKGDPSAPAGYTFEARAGQTLTLTLTGFVVPFVSLPDGNTLLPDTDAVTHQWKFFLPETGKTTLVLTGSGPVSVTARVEPLAGTTALPAAAQGATPILINAKNPMIRFNTVFSADRPQTYAAHLQANQILIISASGAAGVAKLSGPNGSSVELTHSLYSTEWSAPIPQEGDYTIVLAGSGPAVVQFFIP